jgi:hypothetical protein
MNDEFHNLGVITFEDILLLKFHPMALKIISMLSIFNNLQISKIAISIFLATAPK